MVSGGLYVIAQSNLESAEDQVVESPLLRLARFSSPRHLR